MEKNIKTKFGTFVVSEFGEKVFATSSRNEEDEFEVRKDFFALSDVEQKKAVEDSIQNFIDEHKQTADTPSLYVGTYKKYNEGSLFGAWIALDECYDADEFFQVCRLLHADEEDPEFMFQDYMNFPEHLYFESMTEDKIDAIIEFAQLNDDEKEMVEDYYDATGNTNDDIAEIKDACVGRYDSFSEFANERADDWLDQIVYECENNYNCRGALEHIEELRKYFDYEAFATALEQDYYIGEHGWIFYAR